MRPLSAPHHRREEDQEDAERRPRVRLTESSLDEQFLAIFARLRVNDEEVRD